jgi:hypothetical protein
MRPIGSAIYDRDLMKMKGYLASNLDRTWQNKRLGLDRGGAAEAPWPASPERARQWLQGPFLDEVLPYGGSSR